jgi:hypothetical protein
MLTAFTRRPWLLRKAMSGLATGRNSWGAMSSQSTRWRVLLSVLGATGRTAGLLTALRAVTR